MPGPTRKPGPGPWRFGGRRTADVETPQQPLPYYIEDAWDWSEDNTWTSFHADSSQQTDAIPLQDWGADYWDWDSEAPGHDDLTTEIVADSAPVGPDSIPLQSQDEYLDQFEENYEDPIVADAEWSGPIQPNAPPDLLWQDDTDFFDDAHPDDLPEWVDEAPQVVLLTFPPEDPWDHWAEEIIPDAGVDSYFQSDPPPARGLGPEDAWDWGTDDYLGPDFGVDSYLQSDAVTVTPPPATQLFDDAWDWSDEGYPGPDFGVDSYLQSDAVTVTPPPATQLSEDAWDWGTDDYLGPDFGVDSYLQSDAVTVVTPNAAQLPEDAWDWGTDDYLGPDASVDSYIQADAAAVPPSPAQPSDDLEAVTYEDEPEDFFADHFGNADAPAAPAIEDPWDWNADDGHGTFHADSYQNADVTGPPPNTAQLPEEQWDDSQEDVEDDLVDHFTNYDFTPTQVLEDAWDWDTEQTTDDDWQVPDSITPPDVFAVPPMPPEDGWDWSQDYEQTDDYETDHYALVTFTFIPLTVEDAWDWDADAAYDDDALWQIDTAQPTGPNAPVVTGVVRMVRRAHVFVTQDK